MEFPTIEESALETAPSGYYTVLRAGRPVKKVADHYLAVTDEFLRDVPLILRAVVCELSPNGLPQGVDAARIRADGKVLIKTHMIDEAA